MPNFWMNQPTGYKRHSLQKLAVGYDSNAFNVSMVIDDKPDMRQECSETPPPRERPRLDHQAGDASRRRDLRIHLSGELLEGDLLQRTYGNDDQNVAVAQQLKAEHVVAPE